MEPSKSFERLQAEPSPSIYFYKNRCKCKEEKKEKEEQDIKDQKPRVKKRGDGRPVQYPLLKEEKEDDPNLDFKFQNFEILCDNALSLETKLILNSFQKKYLYYAIDDILYAFNLSANERKNLLALLYSPIISLQNNRFINFLDIWIHELYIQKISKPNRFLMGDLESSYRIKMKILYKIRKLPEARKILW